MTWRTQAEQIIFNATHGTDSLDDILKKFTTDIQKSVEQNLKEFDIVGIYANQVGNMKKAIHDYINNIENHLNSIKKTEELNGKYKEAVAQYISAVSESCNALTSQLLVFSNKLDEIEEEYKRQNNSNIPNTDFTFEDLQNSYNEKY